MNEDKDKEVEVEIGAEVWTLQAGNAAAEEVTERLHEGKKK